MAEPKFGEKGFRHAFAAALERDPKMIQARVIRARKLTEEVIENAKNKGVNLEGEVSDRNR